MKKRSYQQFCPLAYSLDLIGERWTLLIVRELSLGSRRYSDLQRGLPGIGPNLLSNRLKELEQAAIVERVYLPPPAKVTAYGLRERGWSLLQALAPLAEWGVAFMTMPPPEADFLSPIATMGSLNLLFHPPSASNVTIEIQMPPDIFFVQIDNGQIAISQGKANAPSLILQTEPRPLLAVLSQALPMDTALAQDEMIIVKGETAVLEQFTQQFRPLDANTGKQ
ncbi:MAG: helix-turn-helix domain-containing protein [Chloroflexota bacterium]